MRDLTSQLLESETKAPPCGLRFRKYGSKREHWTGTFDREAENKWPPACSLFVPTAKVSARLLLMWLYT